MYNHYQIATTTLPIKDIYFNINFTKFEPLKYSRSGNIILLVLKISGITTVYPNVLSDHKKFATIGGYVLLRRLYI